MGYLGFALGSPVLGWFADNFGRRTILFPSLALQIVAGAVAAAAPSVWFLVACRLLAGLGCAGSNSNMFAMLSELVGPRQRAIAGQGMFVLVPIGYCLLSLQAYYLQNWRYLTLVCVVPYAIVLLFRSFVPESVRWLRVTGRNDDANRVLKRIAAWNKKSLPETIQLSVLSSTECHSARLSDLFTTWPSATSALIQGLGWFAITVLYYGISLASDDLGGSMYTTFILTSAVELPALMTTVIAVNRLGRKPTVIGSMFVCGGCCLAVSLLPTSTTTTNIVRITVGVTGKFAAAIAFYALYTWTVELFPTSHRSQGMGFVNVLSKLGGASMPFIVKGLRRVHTTTPFVTMSALAVVASILMLKLAETNHKPTSELIMEKVEPTEEEIEVFL